MHQNKPHIYKQLGNALFVHVPKTFSNEEIESWVNKEAPLGDLLWKIVKPDGGFVDVDRADCVSRNDSWHVCLTMGGMPLNLEATEQLQEGGSPSQEAIKNLAKNLYLLGQVGRTFKRPEEPHIKVDGVGASSLLKFKPELGSLLSSFMHQLMRGPGPIPILDREIIACAVSMINGAMFCTLAHRATGVHLAGGKEKYLEYAASKKSSALGGFAVAVNVNQHVPAEIVAQVKAAGWSDEAIHDATLIVGAFKMMNAYVEGLAARTPSGPDSSQQYAEIGKRLAEQGYV